MSEIYDAMIEHMANIVHIEKRPFCSKDFLSFTVNEKNYTMAYGTVRNYFYKLKKDGEIELVYNSGIAYYTLKGISVGKKITPNHVGIAYSHPFYCFIQDLPLDKNSIHNLHLRFKVYNMWSTFAINPSFRMNSQSKDIKLAEWIFDKDILVTVTVHVTNTVTVIIGCSQRPFPLDFSGILDLSNVITRIEERISTLLSKSLDHTNNNDLIDKILLPSYKEWIVTQWHFGADSLISYSGKTFSIKWETAQNVIVQIYSKKFGVSKSRRIRLERQEYPRKKILEAIEEKLYQTSSKQ